MRRKSRNWTSIIFNLLYWVKVITLLKQNKQAKDLHSHKSLLLLPATSTFFKRLLYSFISEQLSVMEVFLVERDWEKSKLLLGLISLIENGVERTEKAGKVILDFFAAYDIVQNSCCCITLSDSLNNTYDYPPRNSK